MDECVNGRREIYALSGQTTFVLEEVIEHVSYD
jgi:hypothetical protein